jgi:hypothetical protein
MGFRHLVSLQKPRFPPPTWAEIVTSIRALDGAKRPLFTLAPEGMSAEGYLAVQGRPGAYTLTAYFPGQGRFRYHEPDWEIAEAEEVEIFNYEDLRDYFAPRYVCTDLTRVLGVVRHFWEYGELHPAVLWEKV